MGTWSPVKDTGLHSQHISSNLKHNRQHKLSVVRHKSKRKHEHYPSTITNTNNNTSNITPSQDLHREVHRGWLRLSSRLTAPQLRATKDLLQSMGWLGLKPGVWSGHGVEKWVVGGVTWELLMFDNQICDVGFRD